MKTSDTGVEFIIGCQRSGTYLLCTIIDSHLPIAVPVEPQFIPLFRRGLPLWGDLSKAGNRKKLLSAIYDFLEIWTPRSERGKDYAKIHAHSLLMTKPAAEAIAAGSSSYDEIVENLFGEFARMNGKRFSIDKSAFYQFIDPSDMSARSARFIHIVRDGRDVALSWLASWFGPATLAEAAKQWKRHVEGNRRWGKANPHRYLEIRYEDLIADTSAVMRQVARFFGVEPVDFNVELHQKSPMVAALAGGEDHAMISKGINPANCGKWRQRMSARDIRLFEYIAGDTLLECGYSLSQQAPFPLLESFRLKARVLFSKVRSVCTVQYWKRIIKDSLPLIIFVCQVLRVPIAKLGAPSLDK